MGLFKKGVLAGVGLLTLTREKAEKVVHDLVERGEVGTEDAKNFVNELMEKGEQEKAALQDTVKREVEELRRKVGLVTKADLEKLELRIQELEAKLAETKSE